MKTKSRPFLEATMGGGLEEDLVAKLDRATGSTSESSGSRSKKRKLKTKTYDEAEEKALENILFGDGGDVLSKLDASVDLVSLDTRKDTVAAETEPENTFFIVDRTGDSTIQVDDTWTDDKVVEEALDDLSDDELHGLLRPKTADPQSDEPSTSVKKPVWQDEDDEIQAEDIFSKGKKYPKRVNKDDKYKSYLESKFTTIFEPPSWAAKALETKDQKKAKKSKPSYISDSESEDEDVDALEDELERVDRTARDYKQSRKAGGLLDPSFLRVKKCTHLNHSSRVKTALTSVSFHPKSTVALVGSTVGLVRLFQVDGKVNSLIQSVYFRGYRLCDAQFISAPGREEIIVGSDGSSPNSMGLCYYYDMIAGKIVRIKLEKGGHRRYCLRGFTLSPDSQYLAACDQNGHINLLSTDSKEHIAELKMNGEVDCLAFSADSTYLLAHGKGNACRAYVYDIRNLGSGSVKCVNRFTDLGTIEATSMALSADLCAIGSNMGYVNLYRTEDVLAKAEPEPFKCVSNLTTPVTSLKFNHDGQLLMMASQEKDDAIRFVNTRVGTVYKNFPAYVGGSAGKTYGRIRDIDISPNSGYAAWATGNGTAHLFRINEYSNY